MDAHALNEELSMFCENLLSKYKALQNKKFKLNEENENLFSKLNMVLQERVEISSERDSLETQLDLVLKKNNSLKNKIALVSKELEFFSNENISLKNDLASHSCHDSIVIPSIDKNACFTSSSTIENDICMLKKSTD